MFSIYSASNIMEIQEREHSMPSYSQTGYSFDGNFANVCQNIGIWLTVWVEQVATYTSKLLNSFGTSWQELDEIF